MRAAIAYHFPFIQKRTAWPLPAELTDEALEQLLFPAPSNRPGVRRYVEPDWAALVREMRPR